MTGADTTVNAALVIVPLIVIAECFSWHAVLTTKYLHNAIENSIWAVVFFIVGVGLCRLLPEFDGAVRVILIVSIVGIVFFLAFLMTVDVPMYLNRWRANVADGSKLLKPLEGLRDVCTRWIVTHDFAEWKEEIAWMSLYFSLAVWSSLALCVFYSLEDHLPRYRTEATSQPAAGGRRDRWPLSPRSCGLERSELLVEIESGQAAAGLLRVHGFGNLGAELPKSVLSIEPDR